ncbi:TVP38/TMEM64 family protein [Pyxidicoccus sp. 3LFB2]
MKRHIPGLLMVLGLAATLLMLRPLATGTLPALDTVRALGVQGAVLFCLTYSVATLLLLPTTPFTVVAGVLYGPWGGGALLLLLSLGVDLVAFYVARFARGPFEGMRDRFPGLARLDEALGEGGFGAVCLLRLSPLAPYGVLNYALGLTRVSPAAFLAGTAVGSLPATVLFLVLGHGAAGVVESGGGSIGLWATVALTVVSAVGLTAWAKRRLRAPVVAPEEMGRTPASPVSSPEPATPPRPSTAVKFAARTKRRLSMSVAARKVLASNSGRPWKKWRGLWPVSARDVAASNTERPPRKWRGLLVSERPLTKWRRRLSAAVRKATAGNTGAEPTTWRGLRPWRLMRRKAVTT